MPIEFNDIASYTVIIAGAVAAAIKQRGKKIESPATDPPPIPAYHPGDDPVKTFNTLINVINDEQRERAEDRRRFQGLYKELGDQLNIERSERGALKAQIAAEQTARGKLGNELDIERKAREGLGALLTKVQAELTIAIADNNKLIKDNQRLTADNAELRQVNADLMIVIAEQRQAIAAKDQQIDQLVAHNDQLVSTLEDLKGELEHSTRLLKSQVDGLEGFNPGE